MTTDAKHEGLSIKPGEDRLTSALNVLIRWGIRALSILMTLVIFWGIGDVVWVIYRHMLEPPFLILRMEDILDTFGAFPAGLGIFLFSMFMSGYTASVIALQGWIEFLQGISMPPMGSGTMHKVIYKMLWEYPA